MRASRLKVLGIVLGIGVLFYFKYLGFFVNEFAALFRSWGMNVGERTFSIIMPIGISFFTFKLMSYVLEINLGMMKAERNIVKFGTYIAFFPTILSGPIDRPNVFMPQLDKSRKINPDDLSEGFKRVLWGMFLKMCIADRLVAYTDSVLNNYSQHNGTSIIIASVLYLIQMYADFAGYSGMAIGVARMMGLKVIENFNRPFFALSVADYWRRWHMSLTEWITDYVFKPLTVAFRDWGNWGIYLATLINLVLIGIWHGANWTYALFGFYHGLLLILYTATEKKKKKFEKKHNLKNNELYKWGNRLLTFVLFVIGSVLFRSTSVSDFFGTVAQIGCGFGKPYIDIVVFAYSLPFIAILFFKEWKDEYLKEYNFLHSERLWLRIVTIDMLIIMIWVAGQFDSSSFIYFQF